MSTVSSGSTGRCAGGRGRLGGVCKTGGSGFAAAGGRGTGGRVEVGGGGAASEEAAPVSASWLAA
eukprot:12514455-Prorocentrum_lima.AAC.1